MRCNAGETRRDAELRRTLNTWLDAAEQAALDTVVRPGVAAIAKEGLRRVAAVEAHMGEVDGTFREHRADILSTLAAAGLHS